MLVAIVAVVAVVYFEQHAFIYHPRPYDPSYAGAMSSGVIELEYVLPFGKQVAFYAPPRSGQLPARVWVAFCGNGSLALDWVTILAGYPNTSDAFLMIDYPGYGKSHGYATIESTRASADEALQRLAKRLGISTADLDARLCTIGHSLGSAAALDFAANHHVRRALLVSPFTTLREEAATVSGSWLARLLIESYDNRANLREVLRDNPEARIAIFHGEQDTLIPIRIGRELAALDRSRIDFFPVKGGDHVSVLSLAHDEMIRWMTP